MNTKKSAPKRILPIEKSFGQLSLGDKIYLVGEGGLLEINVTGINECQDKAGNILPEVLISSGKLDFRINRYFTTGFYYDYSKRDVTSANVFVATTRAKAGTYLYLVKSTLVENAEKNLRAAARAHEVQSVCLHNLSN